MKSEGENDGHAFTRGDITKYRARVSYLSQDRPGLGIQSVAQDLG